MWERLSVGEVESEYVGERECSGESVWESVCGRVCVGESECMGERVSVWERE